MGVSDFLSNIANIKRNLVREDNPLAEAFKEQGQSADISTTTSTEKSDRNARYVLCSHSIPYMASHLRPWRVLFEVLDAEGAQEEIQTRLQAHDQHSSFDDERTAKGWHRSDNVGHALHDYTRTTPYRINIRGAKIYDLDRDLEKEERLQAKWRSDRMFPDNYDGYQHNGRVFVSKDYVLGEKANLTIDFELSSDQITPVTEP